MQRRRLYGTLAVSLGCALGCGPAAGEPLLVELDVFSGRADPSWRLDERSSAELLQMQRSLTPTRDTAPTIPEHGYRGFVYSDARGPVRAYHGFVITTDAVLRDSNAIVERFLLQQLPEEHAALGSRVAAHLSRLRR